MTALAVETTVQELENYPADAGPVLSVYLLTDPTTQPGRNLHAQFSDLMRALKDQLAAVPEAWEEVERLLPAVQAALEALGAPPRGTAIFAARGGDFVRTVRVPVRMKPAAYWGRTPYLRPLLAALDEFERTLVVLLDKERARFFRVFLQQIEEIAEMEDVHPARHRQTGGAPSHIGVDWRQGGWARGAIPRHEEVHVLWHAKRAADALARLADRERVDRVLVGGTPEVTAEFLRLLPRPLQDRVAGEVHAPMYAPASEVLAAVQAREEEAERAAEERLIDDLIEQAGTGYGLFGLADVVAAVNEQRVYLLVVAEGMQAQGSRCEQCGLLATEPDLAACPACGGSMVRVADLVEALTERVLDMHGRVEEVRGRAAERLRARGGIAALARYALRTAPTAAEPA
jgi:hypothetical protein